MLDIFGNRPTLDVDLSLSNLAFHDMTPDSIYISPLYARLLGLNLNFIPTPLSTSAFISRS